MTKIKTSRLTEAGRDWLEGRGIAPELAEIYGIASVKRRDVGECIAFRHSVDGADGDNWHMRSIGQKDFRNFKPSPAVFWNNQVLRGDQDTPIIITEGHIDALSVITAGFPRTVSVPSGASGASGGDHAGKAAFEYLEGISWKNFSSVILATDGDAPGQLLREDLAMRIGRERCKWVKWPDGCKDANDVLINHGVEKLAECLSCARWLQLDGLYNLEDLPPVPLESPWSTGINGIDDLWRPSPGRMTVLTGIPGCGKTTLITDAVCRLVDRYGIVVAVASFEDDVRESLTPRLRQWFLKKSENYASIDQYEAAEKWISNHFVFIQPDPESEEPASVKWFVERAQAAVIRSNARIVVFDPWNEADHSVRPPDFSQTEYVGYALTHLRRSAKHFRYHLIVAVHPAKMQKNSKGKYPPPTGYDIADSANFVNKPDNGITIHREKGGARFLSWKARREGVIGKRGECKLHLNTQTGRYDLDETDDT